EGRPAGSGAHRLRGLARCVNFRQPACDHITIATGTAQPGLDEDPAGVDTAMTVGEPHSVAIDRVTATGFVNRCRRNEHISHLAAVGARIHPQTAADRSGNAGEEFQPGEPGLGSGASNDAVECTGAYANLVMLDVDARQAPAEADRDTGNAAVADQQIRTDPYYRHRNSLRQQRQKGGEILGVGGPEHYFRRTADPEPGLPADRRILGQPAPYRRKPSE